MGFIQGCAVGLAILICGLPTALGAAIPNPLPGETNPANPIATMLTADIHRGQTGYGISVFSGLKRETFEFEILGVITNQGSVGSMILARFYGHDLERTGILAGMSGSPCFVDGKMIGAVAAAYSESLDPLGFIRPIEEMLAVRSVPTTPTPNPDIEFRALTQQAALIANSDQRANVYHQVDSPLFAAGFDPSMNDTWSSLFQSNGLGPVTSGAVRPSDIGESMDAELRPGDAVALAYVTGDLTLASVGTVTYRNGKDVLIYGHPAMESGSISVPMYKAFIYTVWGSRNISFKYGGPAVFVGTAVQDRSTAVYGHMGEAADLIPMHVDVQGLEGQSGLDVSLVNDRLLLPNLLVAVMTQAIVRGVPRNERVTLSSTITLDVTNPADANHYTISRDNFFSGAAAAQILTPVFQQHVQPVSAILLNPWARGKINNINVSFKVIPADRVLTLEKAMLETPRVTNGENVAFLLTFSDFQGNDVPFHISMRIPPNTPGDVIMVGVGSELAASQEESKISPGKYNPQTFAEMITSLNAKRAGNRLVMWMDTAETGLMVDGIDMPNLPSFYLDAMGESPDYSSRLETTRQYTQTFDSDYFLSGWLSLVIKLDTRRVPTIITSSTQPPSNP